jgi:hypothetical protein
MARKLVNTRINYKRTRVRSPITGKVRSRLKPVKKTVVKQKLPKKITELEIIKGMKSKDQVQALKARGKARVAQTLGTGAETATTAITVGSQQTGTTVNTNNINNNLKQNVDGGIAQSGNRRDEDDEEDYPGVN